MTYGTEAASHMRASIASMRGLFKHKDWETECSKIMDHLWLTDCQSLHDYLVNPVAAGCEDKRLEVDLQGLRENLWFDDNDNPKDAITENQHSKPRWIDTSTMICDPLTKAGTFRFADRLVSTMETGVLDLRATAQSQLKKLKQQKLRMDRSLQKTDPDANS